MKRPTLLLLIMLAGCSSRPQEPHAGNSPGKLAPAAPSLLADTTLASEAALLRELKAQIEAGRLLPPQIAERCWSREESRPAVAESCLLAWAGPEQRSEMLEGAAAARAGKSQVAAAAAVKAVTPMARLSIDDLVSLLQLTDWPIWFRARAIIGWRKFHALPATRETGALRAQLAAEKSLSPADIRESYLALRMLGENSAGDFRDRHCHPLVTDDLRARCWRFLSAFAGPGGPSLPASFFGAWLPASGRSWNLFRLNWPQRAALLDSIPNG